MGDEVVFFSRFVLNENSGGGCRRETQVAEALLPLNFRFFSSRDSARIKNQVSKKDYIKLQIEKKFSPYRNFWVNSYLDTIFKMKAAARQWQYHIKKNKNIKCALVDDPLYFYPLVEFLYKQKIPVVALSQNIESLSFNQLNPVNQLKLFNKEIKLFKKCALVITISREETFLLNNFNIPTYYLPYYPVKSIEERMLKVRERRKHTKKKDFLIIGTVLNRVTFDGMKTFIDLWKNDNNKMKKEKLLAAGYGSTKFLKTEAAGVKNIDFLGEVSNEKLDDILSSIKAMICFQEFGSGALTRISEMLIAGVPVLANSHAARSYHEFNRVVEFSNFEDLEKAVLTIEKKQDPQENKMIKPSHRELLDKVRALMEQ
jgi:hypothetical protein